MWIFPSPLLLRSQSTRTHTLTSELHEQASSCGTSQPGADSRSCWDLAFAASVPAPLCTPPTASWHHSLLTPLSLPQAPSWELPSLVQAEPGPFSWLAEHLTKSTNFCTPGPGAHLPSCLYTASHGKKASQFSLLSTPAPSRTGWIN